MSKIVNLWLYLFILHSYLNAKALDCLIHVTFNNKS